MAYTAKQVFGVNTRLRLFGSRLDDTARGGDVDLLVESDDPIIEPALLAAQLAGKVSRQMGGRKVDVVVAAPNLQQTPLHKIARQAGILL
ncbi:nucleotidyltransferase domain-containing protein [Methylomonas sp. EbA]|uniref:Nucleotidyltransferase domain-containing protein n=2 Tax=Methylomonas albis TaxID=1854563 RepID=A0ABR9D1D3_9GAMM|nr:nucleotidyltransferase domain-containing protein [Methylomonas albis]